jgi:hypothetical protein
MHVWERNCERIEGEILSSTFFGSVLSPPPPANISVFNFHQCHASCHHAPRDRTIIFFLGLAVVVSARDNRVSIRVQICQPNGYETHSQLYLSLCFLGMVLGCMCARTIYTV